MGRQLWVAGRAVFVLIPVARVMFEAGLTKALAEGAAAEDLTARNVHGFFAQCLARDSGALIEHSRGSGGEIRFAVMFPAATDC